jgi:hypothetical protein
VAAHEPRGEGHPVTNTDRVLDDIDHALTDWSVSGDAMRWSPDDPPESAVRGIDNLVSVVDEATHFPTLPPPRFRPGGLSNHASGTAIDAYRPAVALREVTRVFVQMRAAFGPLVERIGEVFAGLNRDQAAAAAHQRLHHRKSTPAERALHQSLDRRRRARRRRRRR